MFDQYQELDSNGQQLRRKIKETHQVITADVKSPEVKTDKIISVVEEYERFQEKMNSYFSEALLHH